MNISNPELTETMFKEYPDVVSVDDMSKMLGICTKTAYTLLSKGEIKYMKVGRHYKIPKIYVVEYLIDESEKNRNS